jgi:hypothetical protein
MSRTWVRLAVVVVVAVTLVSGPLVGGIDFTKPREAPDSSFCQRSGNASVSVVSVDESSFTLEQQSYGARSYLVDGEPTVVSVDDVTGCPLVSYEVRIPALGFFSRRVYFLGNGGETPTTKPGSPTTGRTISMSLVGGSFDPDSVDQRSYEGVLVVGVQGDTNRTIYESNITVGVRDA